MPNLRRKTWTTSTPANVEDAQYWEDHLISDMVASKAASSVQSVNNTTPDAQGNVDIVALPDGGTIGQVLTKQSSVDGDADWEDPASSGHTIEDEDGNTMPDQETLQFENAEVTNDSVNNKTIVDCKGSKGDAATITVGTVTTLPAGSQATVNNSGTSSDAVFDFGIPKGADGSGIGDMTKAEYATNGEAGVVDEAVTLKGLTASIADLNKTSSLATVATSGSYNDLSNKPTAGTGIAINNNVIAVDADNAPTENSEKPVKSKGVYSALESNSAESASLLKSTVGWTGKNDLPIKIDDVKALNTSGTWSGNAYTLNGITYTFTVVNDYVTEIDANGTSTARIDLLINNNVALKNGTNLLSGCTGGSGSTYRLQLLSSDSAVVKSCENGDVSFNSSEFLGKTVWTRITIYNGVSVNHQKFYPMLRDASITDDTYEPYHESVEVMYEEEIHGVNLLQFPYKDNTETVGGITYTVNSDGSITANGIATKNADFTIRAVDDIFAPPAGEYIISRGGSSRSDVQLYVNLYNGTDRVRQITNLLLVNEFKFTLDYNGYDRLNIGLWTNSGRTISNFVIKPMLRKATIEDSTYRPYNEQAIQNQLNAQEVLGAKNLIPYPYGQTTLTDNGISFTDNADGSITFSGTATADAKFRLFNNTEISRDSLLKYKTFIVSGGISDNIFLQFWNIDGNGTFAYAKASETTITFTNQSDGFNLVILVKSGTVISTPITIKPMLRLASDPDDTYVPYAMTNRELTEEKLSISELKTIASSAADFAAFKTAIANL